MSVKVKPHGAVSEQFMRHHYGASGFVPKEKTMSTTTQRPQTLAEKLPSIFEYHSPTGDQPKKYAMIRAEALKLATLIVEETPPCADQTAAIRLLREAVMTANAAIALQGLV